MAVLTDRKEYDERAAIMADDGYTLADIFAVLGPRPLFGGHHPNGGAEGRPGGNGALREALVERPANVADAEARSDRVRESGNGRVAPSLRAVRLSWGGKVERVAKAMARLRGQGWFELSVQQQKSFYALAEFALKAVASVEEDEVHMRKPERIKPEHDAGAV